MILLVLSVGLLVYLFFFAKKSPLLSSFILFHIMTTLWSVYSVTTLYADTFVTNRFMITFAADLVYGKPAVLLGGFTGFAWLVFSLNYVNKAIGKKLVVIFFAPVLLLFISYLTNRYHHLFYGLYIHYYVLFWVNLAISLVYTGAGFIILSVYALAQEKYEKTRTFLLLAAYMIPMLYIVFEKYVRNFIGISSLYPDYITLTPLTFFVANVFIIFIISRYRFLNIKPMASHKIVDNLSMAVIIVDSSRKVINMNRSLIENFSGGKKVRHNDTIAFLNDYIGKNMLDIPANYAVLSAINSVTKEIFAGELIIEKPVRKYYEVVVQPVVEEKDILGRIITFDDNTQIKTAMEQLEEKNEILSYLNNQLVDKNEQLKQYAATAEELAIVKERQRFSRDVHDTLGHTMTVLITQLKVAEILCSSNIEAAKAKISETIRIAKDGLNELRKSIMGIAPGKLSDNNVEASILRLINDFKTTGMKIDVTVNGLLDMLSEDKVQALYRLCQEALTNSLRHGRATHVDIVMNSADDKLKVLIKDNGIGCKYIKQGFGLKGMEQRITSFGGTIHYGSDGENGFNIFVELPGSEPEAG
ncbi:MAG TPA: histidine kinase N-terminal 7TM domain-containing protein [Clostridia bacterium]|nr:histidine kinase N-terminal 7TM domain-containing protein [Clostridia bacterium]